jgi:Ion channel
MWLVIVTLATVGYGDFFLKTSLGRLVGFIVCFWGTFVVSYFVVTVTNMLTFAPPEEKSYVLLQRLHYKEELKMYAVNVLSTAFKHKLSEMKYKDSENNNVVSASRKFRASTLQFH